MTLSQHRVRLFQLLCPWGRSKKRAGTSGARELSGEKTKVSKRRVSRNDQAGKQLSELSLLHWAQQ